MEREAEVVELCLYDSRIGQMVREIVKSPMLAEYLTDALRENSGTLMVARLIVGALTPYLHTAGWTIGRNDVARLGVHYQSEAVVERLSLALKAVEPNYIALSRDLEYSLSYDPVGVSSDTDTQTHHLPRRSAVSEDSEDHKMYLRIFLCAFAMCKRLELDPRQPKQAVAVSSGG
ncbi:hypothetical protein HYV69_03725 [Candidatus Uhrbacteria bacterium]|nr:hypothetical protein [Candidatus Uhrbacteria bacterium]